MSAFLPFGIIQAQPTPTCIMNLASIFAQCNADFVCTTMHENSKICLKHALNKKI